MAPFLNTPVSKAVVSLVMVWMVWATLHFGIPRFDTSVLTPGKADGVSTAEGLEASPALSNETATVITPEEPSPQASSPPKFKYHDTLITFTYAESPDARENLKFFLKQGLHSAADFVFIFNGPTNASSLVPNLDNIRIVRRGNTCFDLGAIGEVMRTDDLWKNYKRFISINASIRGPFLPYWSRDCWSDLYLNKVTDEVKFVGMTVNCFPRNHIQSMIFATDDVGMGILLDPERAVIGFEDEYGSAEDPVGLSGCYENHHKAVHSEIGLATLIQKAGYEVDVMMASFHKAGNLQAYCNSIPPDQADVLYDNKYFGFNIHPYETIFMKTNRGIDPVAVEKLTEWTLARGANSFDVCSR